MEQRVEFVLRALRTENFRALCQEYGISSKTGYKWQERFLRLGLSGMEEESRRPHSHAEQLGERELCAIIRLKMAHPRWGPRSCTCGGMEKEPVRAVLSESWSERD